EFLAPAKRYFIHRVGTEYVLCIEETVGPVSARIIEVLVVGIRGGRLRSPVAVVAAVIRRALGERVSDLVFQSTRVAFLEDGLKRIVFHASRGSSARDLGDIRLERGIAREICTSQGAWRSCTSAVGE